MAKRRIEMYRMINEKKDDEIWSLMHKEVKGGDVSECE